MAAQRTFTMPSGAKVRTRAQYRYVVVEELNGWKPKVQFYRSTLEGAYEALGYVYGRRDVIGAAVFDTLTGETVATRTA